mmetsp:Transcript_30547/g.94926  ORF Transcript_30547/g.94926 Transcript_30547/m.94926 type:complete len:391 (-) Transcript_30547:44-1216(-)
MNVEVAGVHLQRVASLDPVLLARGIFGQDLDDAPDVLEHRPIVLELDHLSPLSVHRGVVGSRRLAVARGVLFACALAASRRSARGRVHLGPEPPALALLVPRGHLDQDAGRFGGWDRLRRVVARRLVLGVLPCQLGERVRVPGEPLLVRLAGGVGAQLDSRCGLCDGVKQVALVLLKNLQQIDLAPAGLRILQQAVLLWKAGLVQPLLSLEGGVQLVQAGVRCLGVAEAELGVAPLDEAPRHIVEGQQPCPELVEKAGHHGHKLRGLVRVGVGWCAIAARVGRNPQHHLLQVQDTRPKLPVPLRHKQACRLVHLRCGCWKAHIDRLAAFVAGCLHLEGDGPLAGGDTRGTLTARGAGVSGCKGGGHCDGCCHHLPCRRCHESPDAVYESG